MQAMNPEPFLVTMFQSEQEKLPVISQNSLLTLGGEVVKMRRTKEEQRRRGE
jgi:hypothetical protein